MKEYIAETGGRYTYADDILNLQELALSMTAIFEGCSNFIVSGCEVNDKEITSGHVWINGKVRYFEGTKEAGYPYYIYEKNFSDSTTYANDENKRGRCNYLCAGGTVVPDLQDDVTGLVPEFIEVNPEYSPRFIDKFFGKYGVLLDTPFSRQTVKKDLILAGSFNAEKDIESKTAVSVVNASTGYVLKNIVKANGDASVGAYLNGLLVNEILIHTDGTFSFYKQDKEIARITEDGLDVAKTVSDSSQVGSLSVYGSHIINTGDVGQREGVNINYLGYKGGCVYSRDFNVYDGKENNLPILAIEGEGRMTTVNGYFIVKNRGQGIILSHDYYKKNDPRLMNVIQWKDGMYADIGSVGYGDDSTTDFRINNDIGSIKLCAVDYVNVVGDLQVNGIGIHITYATKTEVTDQLGLKVDKVAGKQLSTEDFTTDYKLKLGALFAGTISVPSEGYVTTRDVSNALAKKLTIASNLSDLSSITVARRNMSVYSIAEVDDLLSKKLSINQAYTGVTFSSVDKVKLDSLKTGTFTSSSAVQVEGYVTTSSVATELSKKANLLMDGYSSTQKNTIASNLGVYTKSDADSRFASPSNSFQDYITFLVNQGNSTSTAQQILRDKLNTPSKEDLSNSYIRRDGKLSDLDLSNEDAKKQVCRTLGAAYADDCQSKLTDTGWVQMGNSGGVTDTSNLFIRQIGNTVCIQGKVNTGKKNGTHNGGIVAVIPNQISPPKYSLRCALCDFNDDHKYNRGASFVISGNSRNVQIYESGWNNVNTEINFTYMT